VAHPVDEVGVGRAQVGGDVGVLGDVEAGQVDLGEQPGRELAAQEIHGDLAPAEALAEEGVVGGGDLVHGGRP
jgi:hypothetical protein